MLSDNYGRRFAYLRLSLTNVCNFRCQYCLPHGYKKPSAEPSFLQLDEIRNLIRAFTELGMEKIRLTGGEPTLRRDFLEIAEIVASYPAIKTLALTTNGFRLAQRIHDYRQVGINHLNVSVDSLKPANFQSITGKNALSSILSGLDTALTLGFKAVKVNTVLLRGRNDTDLAQFANWLKDRPISLRFIELMQTGENKEFFVKHHLRGKVLRAQLEEQGWSILPRQAFDGPASVYSHPDYQGTFGFIEPYDQHFCASCNRLRITAHGELQLCLFGNGNYSLRSLLQQAEQKKVLQQKVIAILGLKEQSHRLHEGNYGSTKNFAAIGG